MEIIALKLTLSVYKYKYGNIIKMAWWNKIKTAP